MNNVDDLELSMIKKFLTEYVDGIGVKTAELIVEKFKKDTYDIIENKYLKLSEISGISEKKAVKIHDSYIKNIEFLPKSLVFAIFDLNEEVIKKILKKYSSHAESVIENNPYILCTEFDCSFSKIDKIVKESFDSFLDSTQRYVALIKHIFEEALNRDKFVYMYEDEIKERMKKELDNNDIEVIFEKSLLICVAHGIIVKKNDYDLTKASKYYLFNIYSCEEKLSKYLLELKYNNSMFNDIDDYIHRIERKMDIIFDKTQKEAIETVLRNNFSIITGGPGTGKTTIIRAIIALLKQLDLEISLAAPTGKAAKRMEEATGYKSKTVHRLLEVYVENGNMIYNKNESNVIEADVIIIDEASMLDMFLAKKLFEAIDKYSTRVILVGDKDQLPSVSPGNVLQDIINSKIFPVVFLDIVHRQGKNSRLVEISHKINKKIKLHIEELSNNDISDCYFFHSSYKNIPQDIIEIVKTRLPNWKDMNISVDDIQVISPIKRTEIGTEELNKILQEAINPPSNDKVEIDVLGTIFRENDRVMQIANDYNIEWNILKNGVSIESGTGIFNGDTGNIVKIDMGKIFVEFNDSKVVEYNVKEVLKNLIHSYAITIHKSQGSEYNVVIIPIATKYSYNLNKDFYTKNLLYTGITRAKNLAIIVGDFLFMNKIIQTESMVDNRTSLIERLLEG